MARRRKPHPRREVAQLTGEALLRSRCHRQRRKGEWRKAAVTLRRVVCESGEARDWVALGAALCRARKPTRALNAFRQGMYLHKRNGSRSRARTVARLILALDPADSGAFRVARV